jgi:hypothetical protein
MTHRLHDHGDGYGPCSCSHPERPHPMAKSDMDSIPVLLRVGDWMKIRDCLREDADAEDPGPAQSAMQEKYWGTTEKIASGQEPPDEEIVRAEKHDAEATFCHDSGPGTRRCADTINQTLREFGWTE